MKSTAKCTKPKLIVLEDDALQQFWYATVLRDNYDVLLTREGVELIKLIKKEKPNAVFLDVIVPGYLDGLHVLDYIKSNDDTRDIFVAVISALKVNSKLYKTTKYKADAYVQKPVSVAVISSLLRRVGCDQSSLMSMSNGVDDDSRD